MSAGPRLPGEGVKVTEQVPEERVQEAGVKVPIPAGWDEKVTVPVGDWENPPPSVSVTVAVHVVDVPAVMLLGTQRTPVAELLR